MLFLELWAGGDIPLIGNSVQLKTEFFFQKNDPYRKIVHAE